MVEARCTRCKEIFIPSGGELEDLIHGEDQEGDPCGGIGIIQGQWLTKKTMLLEIDEYMLKAFEKHGTKFPHCEDPDCEFHHPEVREPTSVISFEYPYGQGNQGPGTGPEGERLI